MRVFDFFFFFQAEDGIRDLTVTGVQTCALPILNSGPIHGLEVVQADGFGNLDASRNGCGGPTAGCYDYGDAGDPYPGTTGNLAFTPTSVPAAVRNADGLAAGLVLDRITQLVPNGTVQFRVSYPVWVVRAAVDTAAVIQFDGLSYR